MREFTDQGLYNANRLLVLDLEACTRCDECTKACSDTHGGITRLIREGLRLDKWLVASSCRSCSDPYCLVGCPVDAIHRIDRHSSHRPLSLGKAESSGQQRMEIQIEANCIGCGLCASNCPYGNINMHEDRARAQQVATTCDLCGDIVGNRWREVSCVYACPHHAAHRVRGDELLQIVQLGRK
jgi:Fe-S-cluster-containing hydrogenase component 2